MKLIIDVNEETYSDTIHDSEYDTLQLGITLKEIVKNGVPLAKGHGAIIDVKDIERIHIVNNGELTLYKLGTDVEAYIYAIPLVKPDEENKE